MNEQPTRPFRATDVLTGTVERLRQPVTEARPDGAASLSQGKTPAPKTRKQVTLHLTYAQIELLDTLYHRLNTPDMEKKIEKSELAGLAIEMLARLIPKDRQFTGTTEISGYLNIQTSKYPNT